MPLRFYMDEHVEAAITEGLRDRGIDIFRVQDDGRSHTDDAIILDRAAALGRVVFTRDKDFLAETHRRQDEGTYFAGVVYAKQIRVMIGRCVTDLEIVALAGTLEYMANRVEYLPL